MTSLQPHIVLNIISGLSSQHYTFSTSIPLQSVTAGRDILLFASQPDTGVVATDAFQPKPPGRSTSRQSDRSESPVLVHRTSSFPAPPQDSNPGNPREVDPERRVLPRTSTIMSGRAGAVDTPTKGHQRQPSDRGPGSPTKTQASLLNPRSHSEMRNRAPDRDRDRDRDGDTSIDSNRPLLQASTASAQSSPRHRNVLLKKTSLRQRTSSAGSKQQSLAPRSRQVSDVAVTTANGAFSTDTQQQQPRGTVRSDRDSWTMVDAPPNVGRMGVTMYTDRDDQPIGKSDHQSIPAPQITSIGHGNGPSPPFRPLPLPLSGGGTGGGYDYTPEPRGGRSSDQHSGSDESIYETPAADFSHPHSHSKNPPSPPAPNQEFTSSSLPLGQPMTSTTTGSVLSIIPAHLQLRTPKSPNRVQGAEQVDIGVPSVYGSVGYLPSMVSHNPTPSMIMPEPHPGPAGYPAIPTRGEEDGPGQGHSRSPSEALDFLMGHTSATGNGVRDEGSELPREDKKGKGKEGSKRVWDEAKGVWVDANEPLVGQGSGQVNGNGGGGGGADGPGSARTRVTMGQ